MHLNFNAVNVRIWSVPLVQNL